MKETKVKDNLKSQKAITLIALVITIVVLLILAGVSIAMLTGENGILTQAQEAKTQNEIAEAKEQAKLDIMAWRAEKLADGEDARIDDATVKTIIAGKDYVGTIGETSFTTENGYEITYSELYTSKTPTKDPVEEDTSGANHPELEGGMVAITFNADGTDSEVADSTKRDWYNYEVQEGLTNEYNEETGEWGTSHWANAKLNGNYYVWIPRYAYKIDKSVEYTSQSGTSYKIDIIFLDKNNKKEDGTEIEGLITDYTEVNDTKNSTTNYVLHPAFTFGTVTVDGTEKPNELSGIWVGKYETSGTEANPTIVPNKKAAVSLSVAKMFDMAKNVLINDAQKSELDAHMMKNTEWGAVAYLAQSQYGRNGTEISVNQCTGKITGAGRGIGTETDNPIYNSTYNVDTETNLPLVDQQYSGKIGKLSSTTGNIYGIYDMSGGSWEDVMGFYGTKANDGTEKLEYTGFTAKPENKYYNLYTTASANSSNIGDALYEIKGWNSDYAGYVNSVNTVFRRGCDYYNRGEIAGAFSFSWGSWIGNDNVGFRVCLAVQ